MTSGTATIIVDAQSLVIAANASALRLIGRQNEDLAGRQFREILTPGSDVRSLLARGAGAESQPVIQETVIRVQLPDATVRSLAARITHDVQPGVHLLTLSDNASSPTAWQAARFQERASLALAAANMGTWEWDLKANQIRWSPELERVHGLQPGDFDGTLEAAQALLHPLDINALRTAAEGMRRDGRLATEYRIIRPNGEVRWLSVQGEVFTDPGEDEPSFAVGVSVDVSEQKRQQSALGLIVSTSRALASSLDYEATLRAVAELAVPDMADWCSIHVLDAKRRPQVVALHHRLPEKIAWAQELIQRYPPDPDAPVGVPAVIRTGESLLMEQIPPSLYEGLNSEQLAVVRELDLSSYMCVAMSARGRTFGAITLASAESRRHYDRNDLAVAEHMARRAGTAIENALAHQDLEREKAKLESIVAAVGYGVCHLDSSAAITFINGAGAELLGRNVTEATRLSACELVHGGLCDAASCTVGGVLAGSAFQGRDDFTAHSGERIPVELHASPIVVGEGIEGAVLVFHDIRDRLKAERARDDFVAFASHELRSPLTPVLGMASWLGRKVLSNPDHYDEDDREAISTLHDESERLARVVDTFLDLSRIEAGQLRLDHEPMEMVTAVAAEVESVRQRHPDAEIMFQATTPELHALSDELRFRQVLANLLENAVKYGGESQACVDVRISLDPPGVARISVRDNGNGIAEADLPNIFARFYRSEQQSVQRRKGLGIGLFITKQIVDAAAGSLVVDSRPGEGSTFHVSWPLRPPLDARENDAE